MANWNSIKVVFDEPVDKAVLAGIEKEMLAHDYDFPEECLHSSEFSSYRSPMDGGGFIAKVFLKHGAKGQYWLTSRHDAYGEESCHDEDVVVFRPGVNPDSIRDASRLKGKLKYFQDAAVRYIAMCRAFKVEALPMRWEVLPIMHINVMEVDRDLFGGIVLQKVDAT